MNIPDLINAGFELLAALFILNNVRVLWNSRQAYGISLLSTMFFSIWGAYNIWFYPHLGQHLSFYAGILVMLANCFWIYSICALRVRSKVLA
jgi:hypothetical protein